MNPSGEGGDRDAETLRSQGRSIEEPTCPRDLLSEDLWVPRPGRPQWLNAQWLVHPEARVGVRKIERFREWIHEELAAERERTPAEIWEPL